MNITGRPLRVLAALLLAALALVPSIARAHDRLAHHGTPAQEHSRFRWSNSCESVPQKVTTIAIVSTVGGPALTAVEQPSRPCGRVPPSDGAHPVSSPIRAPHGLRAPPLDLA